MTSIAKLGVALFVCGIILFVYWLLSPPTKPFSVIGLAMVGLCIGARLARRDLLRPVKFVRERYGLTGYSLTERDAKLISPAASAFLCLLVAAALLKAPAPGPFALIGLGLLLTAGVRSVQGAYKAVLHLKLSRAAWPALVLYGALFLEFMYWLDKLKF